MCINYRFDSQKNDIDAGIVAGNCYQKNDILHINS